MHAWANGGTRCTYWSRSPYRHMSHIQMTATKVGAAIPAEAERV